MHANEHTLRHLAARVSAGDAGATAELRRELEPHVRRIARRALRPSAAASALTRRVRAAAARLTPDDLRRPLRDPERLAGPVACDLCEALVGRLQAGAVGNRLLETVCD